ncbi:hypothetical protein DY000_02010187 [Brassica cretica]|uniref:Uncharacterized protein n=1 Tax=Brassica cretica TaxID=69181 RepID=A0ABQ7BSH7_BRACR|nr:hypothetical protein DY000_02010187 [Brassica cretica]
MDSDFDAKTFHKNLTRSHNDNRKGFGHKEETLKLMNREHTSNRDMVAAFGRNYRMQYPCELEKCLSSLWCSLDSKGLLMVRRGDRYEQLNRKRHWKKRFVKMVVFNRFWRVEGQRGYTTVFGENPMETIS